MRHSTYLKSMSAVYYRREKKTFSEIGDLLGVSRSRAAVLYKIGARLYRERTEVGWQDKLSIRAKNALRRLSLLEKDIGEIKKAIYFGDLGLYPVSDSRHIPNFGKKTFREICDLAGLQPNEREPGRRLAIGKAAKWTSVNDRLPLSGPRDDKYLGGFYQVPVDVLVDGKQERANFWACWEEKTPDGPENNLPDEFLMEFDVDGVTHWRLAR